MSSKHLQTILRNVINQREDILYNVFSQELALINNIVKTYSRYKIIDLQLQDYIEFNTTQNTPILIRHPEHTDSIFLLVLNNTNIQIKLVNDTGVEKPQPLLQELRLTSSEIEKMNKDHIINITHHISDNIQIDTLQKNNKYISLILPKLDMNISRNFKPVDASDLPTQYFEENISLLTDLNNTNINLAIKKNAAFDSGSIVKKGTIKVLKHIGQGDDISHHTVYDCEDEMCQPIKINYGESGFKDNNSPPIHGTTIFGVPVDHTSVSMNVNPINFSTAKFLVKSVAFVGIADVGLVAILSIDYSVKEETSVKSHTVNNTEKHLTSHIQKHQSNMFYCKGFIYDNTSLDIYYNSLCIYKNNSIIELPVHHIASNVFPEGRNKTDVLEVKQIYTTLKVEDFIQSPINRNCTILDINTNREYLYTNIVQDLNLYILNLIEENRDNVSTNIILNLSHSCLGVFGIKSLVNILGKYQSIALLDLSNNYIGPFGVDSLCDILGIQNIQILDISNNYLGDDGVKNLTSCLVHNTYLRFLKLSSNNITHKGIENIINILTNNIGLIALELSGNIFDMKQNDKIKFYLQQNQYLKNITFGINSFSNDEKKEIARVLKVVSSSHTLTITNHKDLQYHNIQAIAEALKDNTYIKKLNLSSNNMGNNNTKIIMAALKSNIIIDTLNLSFNNIDDDGVSALLTLLTFNPYIRKIDLSFNYIGNDGAEIISRIIKNNIFITELDLSFNHIGNEGANPIFKSLMYNNKMTVLSLSDNCIKQNFIYEIIQAMKINFSLTDLSLDNRYLNTKEYNISFYLQQNKLIRNLTINVLNFSNDEKLEIAKILKKESPTHIFTIINHHLEYDNVQAIVEILKTNNIITSLVLSNNSMDYSSIKKISEYLEVNDVLTSLDLSDNNIGFNGVKAISESLKVNNVLTFLDLSGNNIGDHGTKIISEILKVNSVLTSLYLSDNNIGFNGIKAISESLEVNNVLTFLDLSGNNIGFNGVKAISESLEVNNVLTSLYLSDNNIGDNGAKIISESLEVNNVLTSLDLSDNNIGFKGIKTISEYLKVNSMIIFSDFSSNKKNYTGSSIIIKEVNNVLTSLYLSNNNIGDHGAKMIVEALKVNNILTFLDLSKNNIGDNISKIIVETLKVNDVLTFLDLSFNNISDNCIKKIVESSKANTNIALNLDNNYFDTQLLGAIQGYCYN